MNNYKKICKILFKKSILSKKDKEKEDIWMLTEKEIENLLKDYSVEEIIDIRNSRSIGADTNKVLDKIISKKTSESNGQIVSLYSKFDLPIELTHKLVKSGIETRYMLLMSTEEEIVKIESLTEHDIEIILNELKKNNIDIKDTMSRDRLNTINDLLIKLYIAKRKTEEYINDLEKKQKLAQAIKGEIEQKIASLEDENEYIINNSQDGSVKILRRMLQNIK